jgi:hypothetical protein
MKRTAASAPAVTRTGVMPCPMNLILPLRAISASMKSSARILRPWTPAARLPPGIAGRTGSLLRRQRPGRSTSATTASPLAPSFPEDRTGRGRNGHLRSGGGGDLGSAWGDPYRPAAGHESPLWPGRTLRAIITGGTPRSSASTSKTAISVDALTVSVYYNCRSQRRPLTHAVASSRCRLNEMKERLTNAGNHVCRKINPSPGDPVCGVGGHVGTRRSPPGVGRLARTRRGGLGD